MKKFLILNPVSFGLKVGRKYIFSKTKNGYKCRITADMYIGMPDIIVENNPSIYREMNMRKRTRNE